MKTIELSLSPKYVSGWGVEEAVREILQNAIDQKADGAEVSVSYDRETLSILTDGARLKTSTLLLGESGKDDERYIGKYGEGYKLALLVLTRERKPVRPRKRRRGASGRRRHAVAVQNAARGRGRLLPVVLRHPVLRQAGLPDRMRLD